MKYTNITLQGTRYQNAPTTTGSIPFTQKRRLTGVYPSSAFNYNPRTDPAYDVNWSLPNKPPLFIQGRLGY